LDYEASERFDLIVMNPPFSKEQDIDHVLHAWEMLHLGGLLVAIMSSGAVQRSNTKKVLAFRDWIDQNNGSIIENEAGAFERSDALVKTGVNTITLVVWKRSEEHTSELQSRENIVCRLLLEKKK